MQFVAGTFSTVAANVFAVYFASGVFTLSFRDLRDMGGRAAVIEVARVATGPDGMAWLATMMVSALRSYQQPSQQSTGTEIVRPPNIDQLITELEDELRRLRPPDTGHDSSST